MAILEVSGLCKRFGEQDVLRNVSFSLDRGQTLAVIGLSGSGKTTLLRCLNRLERPDSGQILVNGEDQFLAQDAAGKGAARPLPLGLVFQSFHLFPQYTALENTTLAPRLRAERLPDFRRRRQTVLAEIRRDAEDLLARVGLSGWMNHYPHQLSGGQQQRVAIARALALHPQVLCFDEPTSALDPELTGEVTRLLQSLSAQGVTMLVVTHEMRLAREIADRVLVMEDGAVLEEGDAKELFAHPKTERARRLLAAAESPAQA